MKDPGYACSETMMRNLIPSVFLHVASGPLERKTDEKTASTI